MHSEPPEAEVDMEMATTQKMTAAQQLLHKLDQVFDAIDDLNRKIDGLKRDVDLSNRQWKQAMRYLHDVNERMMAMGSRGAGRDAAAIAAALAACDNELERRKSRGDSDTNPDNDRPSMAGR